MKTWNSLAFAGGVAAIAVTTGILLWTRPELESRSVGPVEQAPLLTPPTLSRSQATGLFVGVRTFPHDDMLTVPYAVDDAVDLAYKFSLDQRSSLIPPRHV